jgi:glycosyltransferase involved in cell wall biosynthesis
VEAAREQPLVSVFTAAHEIGSQIDSAHRSLLRQSHPLWEWVVVDDSASPDTARYVTGLADASEPGRIRLLRLDPGTASIGTSKSVAAGACRGQFLVELDHDDELLPDALQLIAATFIAHPEIDFVYSDWVDWEDRPGGGVSAIYPPGWGLGFGAYASEEIEGRRVPVALAPPLTWETLRHIVSTPNHVRAWRTDFYRRIGGHDRELPVADDYQLVIRTFLDGMTARIPRPLYVQHHDVEGANTSRRQNAEIQARVAEIAARYKQAIDRRCRSLGLTPSPSAPLTGWEPLACANATLDVVAEAAAKRGRPLVSVVVSTYRRPEPLRQALASVLEQSYEELEVLVVGDNCPDVDGVIDSFEDGRIRHWNLPVHAGDSGVGPRNYALKTMARGTLVAYLHEDDRWPRDHLESLVNLLLSDPRHSFAFATPMGMDDAGEETPDIRGKLGSDRAVARRLPRRIDRRHWFHPRTFGPASIEELDLELLAEATGMTPQACLDRLSSWSADELAEEWRRADPATPAEMRDFYARTEGYLWDLFVWHGSAAYGSYRRRIGALARQWPPETNPRALDYGAGIGTAALELAALGYQVRIADIPGRTLDLAQARFTRRGLPIEVKRITAQRPRLTRDSSDVAVCFDVLEHVSDPAAVARSLVRAVRPGGGLAIVTAFDLQGERYPQHLPNHAARFGGERWEQFLAGLGVEQVGDGVYRRTP